MKKFKFTSALLTLLLILTIFSPCVYADNAPSVNARSALALDAKTKIVLYDKNSQSIVPIASTTKIMTAIVALKYGKLDKKITVSAKASSIRGSTVGYKKGEEITLKELLFGLMLRSGNDAAIATAEGMSGSVEEFCKLMNEEALELGLTNSHFESPHGLDSENHYATAYELAVLSAKAKEYKLFCEIVGSKDVEASKYGFTRSYHNINKILWLLNGADGIKTGSTGDAGKCLVTSVKINGHDIIIVLLNCPGRWKETIKIYNYVLKNYNYREMYTSNQLVGEVTVNKSRQKIKLKLNENVVIPIKKGSSIKVKLNKPESVKGDILVGEKLGSLGFYQDDKLIYTEPLISDRNIIHKKFFK